MRRFLVDKTVRLQCRPEALPERVTVIIGADVSFASERVQQPYGGAAGRSCGDCGAVDAG